MAAVFDGRVRSEDTGSLGGLLQIRPDRVATGRGDVATVGVLDGKHLVADELLGPRDEVPDVIRVGQVDRHAELLPYRPIDRSVEFTVAYPRHRVKPGRGVGYFAPTAFRATCR